MKIKNKVIEELQKDLFSKIDMAVQDYLKNKDERRATAFAFKMHEAVASIMEHLEATDIKSRSDKEKEEILKFYHKQMTDMIPIIKNEIEEAIKRENQIPSYIGFYNHNEKGGYTDNEKNS